VGVETVIIYLKGGETMNTCPFNEHKPCVETCALWIELEDGKNPTSYGCAYPQMVNLLLRILIEK